MNILDSLKGRNVKIKTDVGTDAILSIKKVEKNSIFIQTGESTKENDWYPDGHYRNTYIITFENGYSKEFNSLESIDFLD